jgi:hypothetical protein
MNENQIARVTVLVEPPWLDRGITLYHIGPTSVEVKDNSLFRVGHSSEWRKIGEIPRLIAVLNKIWDGRPDVQAP